MPLVSYDLIYVHFWSPHPRALNDKMLSATLTDTIPQSKPRCPFISVHYSPSEAASASHLHVTVALSLANFLFFQP